MEVGCGSGLMLGYLSARLNGFFVGADIAVGRLKKAGKLSDGLVFLGANSECLSFRDRSFDVVFANTVLHHVCCVEDALAEMIRVCKPGGIVAFIEPNRFNFLQALAGALKPTERGILRLSVVREVEAASRRSGRVKDYEIRPVNTFLYPYRSFPPHFMRKIVAFLEVIFERRVICTHYLAVVRLTE